MRQVLLITGGAVFAVALIFGFFALSQANQEELDLTARLQSRSQVLADSLGEAISPSFIAHATSTVQKTVDKFATSERLAGLGVYDAAGSPVAVSQELPLPDDPKFLTNVMDSDTANGAFVRRADGTFYTYVVPLHQDDRVVGALAISQNATYIDESIRAIWWDNFLRLALQILLFAAAIFFIVRWVFYVAVRRLALSLQEARRSGETELPTDVGFLAPLVGEITKVTQSLRQARHAASEEARMRLEKLDSPWTAERLAAFIKTRLKDRAIFVISDAEPYVHSKQRGKVETSVPAGGVITAIEPIMEACGGTWIARGKGDADKETADEQGKLKVPPEEPKYTLKRVFLGAKDRDAYYLGLSNQALWPLCHLAHVRPEFKKEDWLAYRKVNGLFAKALLEEIRHLERPIVLVQDYHLALLPALIKKSRPDAQVAIFWHIPWPSAAQFSICPWRREILEGILGADLVGFHTQQYCNNFMDTVAAEIESRIDYERFAVIKAGHESRVEAFPISIAFPGSAEITTPPDKAALERLGIRSEFIGLGVDRLDYIKGIPERLRGVEFFLDAHPEYRGRFTFVQVASPTRTGIGKYEEYTRHVLEEAERINGRFQTAEWKPIVLEHRNYSHQELRTLYQLADVCLVTSLHDGMNLVAKEYVAARGNEDGVLILSHFTGASRDLTGALVVNPYSAEETSEALFSALTMPASEQRRRMKAMRDSVRDYNVYRWSAELIRTLSQLD